MPEGPEIRRAADSLEAAIKGEPLTGAWFAFPQLQHYQSQLVGQRVTHIETRGKALLTHFSGGLTLYSHNQLYGVWRVVDAGEQPETTRVLRVRLQTARRAILLYSASDIEMLTPEQLARHPFLLHCHRPAAPAARHRDRDVYCSCSVTGRFPATGADVRAQWHRVRARSRRPVAAGSSVPTRVCPARAKSGRVRAALPGRFWCFWLFP